MIDLEELRAVLAALFPDGVPNKGLRVLEPALALRNAELSPREAATIGRTTQRRIEQLAASDDLLRAALGDLPAFTEEAESKYRAVLGQLILGQVAEQVFEDLWRQALGEDELRLRDDRAARTDTDFVVTDRTGRQVFRLNIKFHGATFRNAAEMVGLDPEDTFALATYKIHGALEKQDDEHLPYIFVVIGVRGLTGAQVGALVPDSMVRLVALAHATPSIDGKRGIEEKVVSTLLSRPVEFGLEAEFNALMNQLAQAEWRVISARRADQLLRQLLFKRAYALRVRAFAQNYRGAELDMHFSIAEDLHPLDELFQTLLEHGMPGLVTRLERGTL